MSAAGLLARVFRLGNESFLRTHVEWETRYVIRRDRIDGECDEQQTVPQVEDLLIVLSNRYSHASSQKTRVCG